MQSRKSANEQVVDFVIALGAFEHGEMEKCKDVVLLYAIQQSCEAIATMANQRLQGLCPGGVE